MEGLRGAAADFDAQVTPNRLYSTESAGIAAHGIAVCRVLRETPGESKVSLP
jgi:hypothetical protein